MDIRLDELLTEQRIQGQNVVFKSTQHKNRFQITLTAKNAKLTIYLND